MKRILLVVCALGLLCGCQQPAQQTSTAGLEGPNLMGTAAYVPDIETFMQIGYCGSPDISEDGKVLFFESRMSGVTQFYRISDERWPTQLTYFKDGIDFYSLSHNSRWAVVGAGVGGDEQSQLILISTETGRAEQLTEMPDVQFGSPIWSPDDTRIYYRTNQQNGQDFHVYEMNILTRETRPIVEKEGYNGPMALSLDGKKLVQYTYFSSTNDDLYLIDLETLASDYLTPHKEDAIYDGFGFAADGNSGYLISDANDDRIMRRATMDLATKEITFIDSTSQWEVESLELSPDRTKMAWLVNEEGYADLHVMDLTTNRELPAPPMKGMYSGGSISRGTQIVFGFTSPAKAPDCWVWDWSSRQLKQFTFSTYAGIDPAIFIEPELIKFPSFDGMEIPAFLYLPPAYSAGNPVPFVVYAHGGPESQFRPNFIRNFQFFLANGFGVMAVNPRGSSGYGQEYILMDNYKNRLKSVQDYEYANRFLREAGYAKPDKIAVMGGSYGGYMVLACLTENPDLWAAGVNSVGIANFISFLQNTRPYRRALREAEYGPLSDPDFLASISPINKVDRIVAPLLIIHGENDPRVPVGEARQIAKALGDRGIAVDTLIFPDEGHGTSKRSNVMIDYRRRVDFLKKHLQ
ncbi:S9 family peptidase [Candidatus Zixiibacteriota bacterium]